MAEVGSLALLIHANSLRWFLNLQSRQVSGFGGVAKRLILPHLRLAVFRSVGTPTDSKRVGGSLPYGAPCAILCVWLCPLW